MGNKYIRKPKTYTEEELKQTVDAVRAGQLSLRKGAKLLKVSLHMLKQRVNGEIPVVNYIDRRGKRTVLQPEDEAELADYLKTLAKWGFVLTRKEFLQIVGEYCRSRELVTPFKNNIPGRAWFINFCERNGLSLENTESLEKK